MEPDRKARNWDSIPRIVHVLSTTQRGCGKGTLVVSRAAGRNNRRLSIDPRIFGDELPSPTLRGPLDGCAAVVVLSQDSADHELFVETVRALILRSAARDDFRVFVLLDDIDAAQFHDFATAEIEPFDFLHDNIQLPPGLQEPGRSTTSIDGEVVTALAEMLASLRDIRDRASWRQIRTAAGVASGHLAASIQLLSPFVLLCGWTAFRMGFTARIPVSVEVLRKAISLSAGIVHFWSIMFPAFFVFRGFAAAAAAARNARWVAYKNALCALISGVVLKMAFDLGAGNSWVILGLAIGACVDGMRRAGLQSQRLRYGLTIHSVDPEISGLAENLAGVGPLNIFRVPLWPPISQFIVISYARASRWSYDLATRLFSALANNAFPVFLDRENIPVGSNWRRELQYEIGGANTFIGILDQVSLTRPWVATEVVNALRGQALTGSPRIITLENGVLNLDEARPIFKQTLEQDTPEGTRMHLIRRIRVSRRTVDVLASELTPARFKAISVVPQALAIIFEALVRPVTILCAFAAMMGLLAWVGWGVEMWNNMPILHWLRPYTAMSLFLLLAYLAGCGLRLAVLSRFQVRHDSPGSLAASQGFGTIGLILFCAVWLRYMPPLIVGWALVAALFGWWRAGSFFGYSAIGDQKLRRS